MNKNEVRLSDLNPEFDEHEIILSMLLEDEKEEEALKASEAYEEVSSLYKNALRKLANL